MSGEQLYCKVCGARLTDPQCFCPSCGAKLEESNTKSNPNSNGTSQNSNESNNNANGSNQNSNGSSGNTIVIVILVILGLVAFGQCSSSNDPDNWGAAYDWGPDHYWDTNSHSVKEKTKCVARGTLITMADGTEKAIEDLKITDKILAFDHMLGEYVEADPIAVYNHGYALYHAVDLEFSDGKTLCVIEGHTLFDLDLMKYVEITPDNCTDYIGHSFVKYSDKETVDSSVLISANAYDKYDEAWGTWGFSKLSCVTNGILSIPNAEGTYNYFMYDDDLKYNEEAMASDIEKYGLYTYEDWADLIPYSLFEGFNFQYFKVAIGKGLANHETYMDYIELFYELSNEYE